MNKNRKHQPIIAFLILQIIIYLSINNVQGISALSILENVPYPFYPAINANMYQVEGDIGFSVNPSKTPQPSGTITSQYQSADANLIKALYYGYSGPGNLMSDLSLAQQKTYTHLLASYIYSMDMGGLTFYTLQSYFNCNLIDYYNQLPYLQDPNHYELAFTNERLDFVSDGLVQRSDSTRLVATDGTGGYFDLPDGLTIVNETTGIVTTSQRCHVQAQDLIHFEAAANYLGEFATVDFTLARNVFDYRVNLAKVQGTVDPANPVNDGYQAVASLLKIPKEIHTSLDLEFQFKPKLSIKAQSDKGDAITGQAISVTGPGAYANSSHTDGNGILELVNLEPGTYFITPAATNFPYRENTGVYSVTVNYRQSQEMTIIFDELTQATATYLLNGENPPLLSESFNINDDYQTRGFADFMLDGYDPTGIAIVKDGLPILESKEADEVINGILIGKSDFSNCLDYVEGGYRLTIDLKADLSAIAIPVFSGRNGIINIADVNEANLKEMIYDATKVKCMYEDIDETAALTVKDLNIDYFNRPGIAVVEFNFLSPAGLNFKKSYNVLVVGAQDGDGANPVRFIDKDNFNKLGTGFFGTVQVANSLLEDSLFKEQPVLSCSLKSDNLQMIKEDYRDIENFDRYYHEAIETGMSASLPPIETAQIEASFDEGRAISIYAKGVMLEESEIYLDISNYRNGQVECLLALKETYSGSLRINGYQNKTSMAMATIEDIAVQRFNGVSKYPEPVIYVQDNRLLRGRDYQLSYADNVQAGEATIIVMGINRYQGELTVNFKIEGE